MQLRWLLAGFLLSTGTLAAQQDSALHKLFDSEWQAVLAENPTYASTLGMRRFNRQWPDVSLAGFRARADRVRRGLQAIRAIDPRGLSAEDQLNHRLFERQYAADVRAQPFRLHLLALNQREGIQFSSQIVDRLPFDSLADYRDWIARLNAFPLYMARTMALLKQGVNEGMVHPLLVVQRVLEPVRAQIVDHPEDSPYYKPFRRFAVEVSDADGNRLRREASEAIARCVIPSFRELLKFLESECIPACSSEIGCWRRPRGSAMYAVLAQRFTTTELTPAAIHQIGLDEVARIRRLMEEVHKEVGFRGSFAEFLQHLRTDRRFYFKDGAQLLAAYRDCCAQIDRRLPELFHELPGRDYVVRPIPLQRAPGATTAYYQAPAADGRRPGIFYVNLHRPQLRARFEVAALSLHEAVPGHHLQVALSMELQDIPEFRRYGGSTAFIEGWGLYSEKLGAELGMYRDPYSRFGQLSCEMWRAARLVVDTGMHSMRWSRSAAVDFLRDNTAKSILDIENEVDRYIAWPGQALAYKIGELKFTELRARAEEQLGDSFDIRQFHNVVLRNGPVPLDVLESIVDDWLSTASAPARGGE